MEFIFGFFMGNAVKGNPWHTVLGFALASLLLGVFLGFVLLVWHFAPQAADFIQWTGATKFLPYLNIDLQDDDWFTGGLIPAFSSRVALCVVAMLIVTVCFWLACCVLKGAIWAVVKVIRLIRPARNTSA